MNEILIVAAEASSAVYAKKLLEHWQAIKAPVKAFGVGSQEMEAMGFERLGRSEDMAVVGIAEVIEHYSELKSVFWSLVTAAKVRKPKVAIIMDYPDFNLKLAGELKKLGIPVIYYIAPQVWAWRKGRIHKIREVCDQVLLLFPFELRFYEQNKVKAQFVGHPILDEMSDQWLDVQYQTTARARFGFHDSDLVLGLMPGSRKSELALNLPLQLDCVRMIERKMRSQEIILPDGKKLKIAILVAPSFTKERLREAVEKYETDLGQTLPFSYTLLRDEPFAMISIVDVMLAASGTATLMVGLLKKPMVIMYQFKTLTWWIANLIFAKRPMIGLPNLILEKEICPESLQESAEEIVESLIPFLTDTKKLNETRDDLGKIQSLLGKKGVAERVTQVVFQYLK
jgi:lipid-A-disaccharide synthase